MLVLEMIFWMWCQKHKQQKPGLKSALHQTAKLLRAQEASKKKIKIKIKKQPMDWEKIFENHIFDKGLKFKIYKELIQLKSKTVKQSDFKMGQHTK